MSNIKTRMSQKHNTEAYWSSTSGFKPLDGELIIYDPDDKHDQPRIKVGDGITDVNDLPFIYTGITDANVGKLIENDDGEMLFLF